MIDRLATVRRTILVILATLITSHATSQDNATPLPVWGLSFSPDGTLLAAAAGDREGSGVFTVWRTADWSPLFTQDEPHTPTCAAFSPDGTTLLIGTRAAEVVLVNVAEGRVDRRWDTDQQGVNGVTWTPNGEQLLTAGSDGTIRVWNASSGELRMTLDTWIADGAPDRGSQPQNRDSRPAERLIWDIAVSPDGQRLVSGGWGDTTRLWNLETGELIQSFVGTDELVQGVAFTPDGLHFIASSQRNGDVRVRETHSGLESAAIRAYGGRDIAMHPDGAMLAVASRRGVVAFQLKLGIPTDAEFERYQQLISKFEDDDIEVREAASAEVLEIGSPIAPLLFDALEAPGAETRMRSRWLWNRLRESEPIAEMTGHDGELRQVVFSPDGALLASAGKDGDVRIWSVPAFALQRVLSVSGSR